MLAVKAIEDINNDAAFWTEMERTLAQRLEPMNERALLLGIDAAASVGVIVDFDAVHAEALQVARTTSSLWWGKMAETTREALRQALITWQETGVVTPGQQRRGLSTLIESLEPMFGQARARRIAVTETTRLFAEGNRLASRDDDSVGGEQWQTAGDELVCVVCGPRDNKIWPKDIGPDCPAHVGCRCVYAPATWSYIREHPSLWQGPALGAPVEELPVQEPSVELPSSRLQN